MIQSRQGLDEFFAFLPRLLGFLLILLIGYIVAKVVKGILTKVLERVGLDRRCTPVQPAST